MQNELVGWVPENQGRGSLGIILSSLTTLFLCTWVVLHARVHKRSLVHRLHKLTLFLKCIVAPEFVAVEGLQEWFQARKMVRTCERSTSGGFKPVHGFFIGMLALRYRTPLGEKIIWPNQYAWLLEQGFLRWDDHAAWGLSEEDIRDKSNTDGAAKLLALGQVSWFVAQSIMREAHSLPLAQLETMTLSYIPLVAITYFFWWNKPKDIMTASVVDLPNMTSEAMGTFESMAVSSAFDTEGLGKQNSLWSVWALTPRVFEKEAEDRALANTREVAEQKDEEIAVQRLPRRATANGRPSMFSRVRKKWLACLPRKKKGPRKETVVAYWDPDVFHSRLLWVATCLFGASFGALHLISWNAAFPTALEQWLWRIAALVSTFSMLVFMQFEKVVLRWGGPLTMISLISPALYLLSRIVMMGGVIAAFRASDPETYDTYHVSNYWIHVLG